MTGKPEVLRGCAQASGFSFAQVIMEIRLLLCQNKIWEGAPVFAIVAVGAWHPGRDARTEQLSAEVNYRLPQNNGKEIAT